MISLISLLDGNIGSREYKQNRTKNNRVVRPTFVCFVFRKKEIYFRNTGILEKPGEFYF